MGYENSPQKNYLEDTDTRFVRIELEDRRLSACGPGVVAGRLVFMGSNRAHPATTNEEIADRGQL